MSERFVLPLSGNIQAVNSPATGKLTVHGIPLSGFLGVGSVIFNDYILELLENDTAYMIIARRGSEVQTLEMPKSGMKEMDPTVPAWAKEPDKPSYTADEVGADPSGSAQAAQEAAKKYTDQAIGNIPTPDVSGQIGAHNLDPDAHPHIQQRIDAIKIPAKVSAFENDAGYLTEHQDISGKLDASALPAAVNDALAQAKASGEFDGENGVGITSITIREV